MGCKTLRVLQKLKKKISLVQTGLPRELPKLPDRPPFHAHTLRLADSTTPAAGAEPPGVVVEPRDVSEAPRTRAVQPGLVSPDGSDQAQRHHPASLSSESGECLRHVGYHSVKCVRGSRP
jgi:hypothetical protein